MPDQKYFPSTKEEALALAYVQGRNWDAGGSALSILNAYETAYELIREELEEREHGKK